MSDVAACRPEYPAAGPPAAASPPAVRRSVTVLAVLVALLGAAALSYRSAISTEAAKGAALQSAGEPVPAYERLLAAVNGSSLDARPCIDLGDLAVSAIDDDLFRRYHKIDDAWMLARLALLSYAEGLNRLPGAAGAWAGLGRLFRKVRVLRLREGGGDPKAVDIASAANGGEEERLVIEAYRRAVKSEPNNPTHHADLGDFFDDRGHRREALGSYARAAEITPVLSEHDFLPREGIPEDLYKAVAGGLRRALDTNTGYPKDRIWQNLGDLAERGKDAAAAEEHYKQAIANAVDPSPHLQILGALYFAQKRYEEAEKVLEQALERDTLRPQVRMVAHTLIGRAVMIRGDPAAALGHLQHARWLDPSGLQAALDLARAFEVQRLYGRAETEYLAAIRLDPARASTYSELIDMYIKTRQNSKAISLAQRRVEVFPESQGFKDQLGALVREPGRGGVD